MMKAVRMVKVGAPLEMLEVELPGAGAGEVLVRVKAAGICHSDAHYRAGKSRVEPLPLTLGHEVAGVVEALGAGVKNVAVGERVCLHYNMCCGECGACRGGVDQFCAACRMIGHYADGGYAEFIVVPARNAIRLPEEIPFEAGATLMCASATSYHALKKGRVKAGERVAVFGIGGLGMSAIQLAKVMGAREIFAVDIKPEKLAEAERLGAVAIDARRCDAAEEIWRRCPGGVDVALELIGLPETIRQSLRSLGNMGRAVVAGITNVPVMIDSYRELLGNERELIGSNDHTLGELPEVVELARRGLLDVSRVVTRTVPLEAGVINGVLDELESFSNETVRTVIVP
jgi:2-desacetyl-2-hydroxyethyl bacteriochlorophyllide A dehydrogenase